MAEELAKMTDWDDKDGKACSVIVLNISDTEMVYVIGSEIAAEMWERLKLVKESTGGIAKLTACRKLYLLWNGLVCLCFICALFGLLWT
jgi:hypothetical protein